MVRDLCQKLEGHSTQEKFEQELENAKLWRDYVNGERETPSKILVGEKN